MYVSLAAIVIYYIYRHFMPLFGIAFSYICSCVYVYVKSLAALQCLAFAGISFYEFSNTLSIATA